MISASSEGVHGGPRPQLHVAHTLPLSAGCESPEGGRKRAKTRVWRRARALGPCPALFRLGL